MSLKVGNFESFGIPVFWVGEVKAENSFSVTYQRLAFRNRKDFFLWIGVLVLLLLIQRQQERKC